MDHPAVLCYLLLHVRKKQHCSVDDSLVTAMVVDPRMIGWTNVSSKAPASTNDREIMQRAGHSATPVGTDIYIFGGKTTSGHFCSDVCKLDTATGKWSTGFLRPPFINLAYHSATLIGAEIWVVGGSDDKHTSPHVYVLDTTTLKWRTVSIRGDTRLLQRTAHGCTCHPHLPKALLLFGGWGKGARSQSDGSNWLNDMVLLRLDTLKVEALQPQGTPPTARAYHTFNAMGDKCYVVGGRTSQETLLGDDQLLCVYDVATNEWVSAGPVSGSLPARSSHRGVVVRGSHLLICGGAGKSKLRMDDTHVLKHGSNGQLSWRRLSVAPFQPGRTAQGMAVCNDRLYIIGGYGARQSFLSDVWSLPLGAVTGSGLQQAPVHPQSAVMAVEDEPARKCEATCWRSAKRSRPAGAADAAPAHKRQHALAPAGAVATALPSHSHPEQQPAREVAAALPPPGLLACSNAMMPHALADRSVSAGCAMLSSSAAAPLYGGCAFNDAAAMSAAVSRLEGDLSRAKAALNERLAVEESQLRQRRDMEAEVARLRVEVSATEQRCTTATQQCMHFQRLSEERLQRLQATETAAADANNRAAAAVATAGDLQRQLSGTIRQRDDFSRLVSEREEASKAAEADAVKARSMLRQERGDWERADAESRTALQGLREEGRMLQGTNAQLHADVTRLTKGLEGAEEKVSEGVSSLAEVRRKAGEEREQSTKALQAQQAATQAAQHQLQAAQARITTAEAAHKKSEAELALLRPQAASLEQQLSESQVKLKAAQADVTSLRAEALRNTEFFSESNKGLQREGQHLADHCNELLKMIAQRRSHSPALAQS